jgi:malate dehydrogenase (oxaloacetate-decarboxylating)
MGTEPYELIDTPRGTLARVRARGFAVLSDPALNRGCAFTPQQRRELGLVGLLPELVSTLDAQLDHCYDGYRQQADDRARWAYLSDVRCENEVLFHRLIAEYIAEVAPILRDPAGLAPGQRRRGHRRQRAVYLSVNHPEDVEATLRNTGLDADEVDLLVATDSVGPSNSSQHGVDRIDNAAGTLALYTAAAGIVPRRTLPVLLDVGTDDMRQLTEPSYLGARHAAVRDDRYDRLIDAFVTAATKLWPTAVLHWAGLAPAAAERILDRYANQACVYDDDLQGQPAVALAAALSAARATGRDLREQSVVIHGAGTSARRIADALRQEMIRQGLDAGTAGGQVRLSGRDSLADLVADVRPSMLIGVAAQAGAFTEALVTQLAEQHHQPIIMPLSRPPAAEASAADLLRWTDGRALVVTGSPTAQVAHRRRVITVAHADSALLSAGICLGATVARAGRVTDDMIAAAAAAVAGLADRDTPGAALLPPHSQLRRISATVGVAVARAAERAGVAQTELSDAIHQVYEAMWRPQYPEIEALDI